MEGYRKPHLGPDAIRELRGARSRAAFAQQLGVTPLTVYRWELPDGAPQARRPRGQVAARLAAVAFRPEPASPAASPAPLPAATPVPLPAATPAHAPRPDDAQALEPAEQTELLPLLERLSYSEPGRVENELLALMASGRLRTLAGRAMAAQALAQLQLFARADVCGAFAVLAPFLPELGRLPEFIELQLHATAAVIFSWPDGRLFDAGRTNTHLAHAERLLPHFGTPETRFPLATARISLALCLGAAELMASALPEITQLGQVLTSPVQRTALLEAEAHVACLGGRFAAAAAAFQHVAEHGALALSRVRSLGQLALMSIQAARPPREALGLVERARSLALSARLRPEFHTMLLDTVEGTALSRLARFADAARVLGNALEVAAELRWTPAYAALTLAHLHFCTGRPDALRALGRRLGAYDGATAVGMTRALGGVLITCADVIERPEDGTSLLGALDRQVEEFERDTSWLDLRGEVSLAMAMMAARVGSFDQAQHALRRAERHFERFPSIWASAVLRRSRGLVLARQGQLHEARQLVESALGTLSLAEDVGNATDARLVLAEIGAALGEPTARGEVARCRAELARLGFVHGGASGLHALGEGGATSAHTVATHAAPRCCTTVDRLIVPLQRLTVRGMSAALIQRELVTVVTEQVDAAVVCLEEVDSAGKSTQLLRVGPEALLTTERVELSDGAGRRLRLAVGGPGISADTRALLAILSSIAELALELAALRSFSGARPAPGATVLDGDVPEIPGFISVSAPMRQLKADLVRLSRSRATIIITGESGSGKEVVARAIHDLSTRASRPYIAFNCAAVPRDLFEGQLFGYRKGAFTGAAADQPGVLRAAEGGTVLLDEIGELPLDVQPKLLRFLENGEVFPLGERKPVQVDVRVIAATYRDLEELVRERRFREDLFYRLQVVPLRVPPLRERPDDLVALARYFIGKLSPEGQEPPVLAPDALAALHAHGWPGNVRELRNVIERSLAFAPLPPVLGAEQLRIAG